MTEHLPLDKTRMLAAFRRLDELIAEPLHLVVGGGAAMALAYDHPLATQDVDAFAARGRLSMADIDSVAKGIGRELDIEPDWLNAHFETFTHVVPPDYRGRLRPVFQGKHLTVDALGPEDLLVMKCFAGREKDKPHARKLVRLARDLDLVDRHITLLLDKRVRGADKAIDFFDDLRDEADL